MYFQTQPTWQPCQECNLHRQESQRLLEENERLRSVIESAAAKPDPTKATRVSIKQHAEAAQVAIDFDSSLAEQREVFDTLVAYVVQNEPEFDETKIKSCVRLFWENNRRSQRESANPLLKKTKLAAIYKRRILNAKSKRRLEAVEVLVAEGAMSAKKLSSMAKVLVPDAQSSEDELEAPEAGRARRSIVRRRLGGESDGLTKLKAQLDACSVKRGKRCADRSENVDTSARRIPHALPKWTTE